MPLVLTNTEERRLTRTNVYPARILKGTTFAKYRQFIENCFAVMPRHALHARLLGFEHPATHEEVLFESPLPADFTALLAKWDVYTSAAKETGEA